MAFDIDFWYVVIFLYVVMLFIFRCLGPSKVSNLTTSNTSSTSIAVTWLKPEIPNGVISHYKIVVEKVMEESQILEQNIWLRCVDCQSMCPSAESNKTVRSLRYKLKILRSILCKNLNCI